MKCNLPIPAHIVLRRRLKSLGTGQEQRQRVAENTLRRFEIGLTRAIKEAKNDFIGQCAAAYRSHKERDFHTQLITHRVAVKLLLTQQAQQVIPVFAQDTLNTIRVAAKGRSIKSNDLSLYNRLIQLWLAQRQQMAGTIAQTTLNDVLAAVQDGLDNGDGTDDIAQSIQSVTSFSPYRSATVARTETHGAALFAQIASGRQAEQDLNIQLVKTWLPTLDDRTRDAHAEMADYGAIPLDQKFIVGGEEMDRPGDPAGSPGNLINCRCSMFFAPRGTND